MKRIAKLVLLLTACTGIQQANAQVDPHFSQYYVYPSWLNPALTGVFDGEYRISGVYRNQWSNISPITTAGISADINTSKNVSFSGNFLSQKANNGGYTYTTGYGSMAYSGVRFGKGGFKRITMDIQVGFIQRRLNPAKFHFGDEYDAGVGAPVNPTSEVLTNTSATAFDAGAGILYYDATPGKKANVFGGFSVSHLTRPENKFSKFTAESEKLPIRYNVHAGVRLLLSENVTLTPNLMYMHQGTAQEKMAGAYVQMKATMTTDFMFGANYRLKDAVSPYVGFTYKTMSLGLSYDINTSDLGRMASGTNAFEITLSFIGKKTPKTPEAEFVCPRL